ncbi:MAG: glycine betaine ABC transporter substrate-binding protein [Desulfuromonadales bacterium]|nr:glycine betaine ABC transporter substrate-binding protein [Desulfuromonadales bacterium]
MGYIRTAGKIILTGLVLLTLLSANAWGCVGKTLVIGASGTPQQEILAEMLGLLISERTGTTVKVVSYPSHIDTHQALLKADIDLYVEYTGVGQVTILGHEPLADAAALYQAVKSTYNQELNLIWLKPLGFEARGVVPEGVSAQAAPVVRKDTLKKFPALARLIDKLGGAIDAEAMAGLERAAAATTPREAARKFLQAGRFI